MNNINPFIFHYNTDEKGNPTTVYIEGESVQTSPLHYCVQLKQIPKKNKGLVVLDDTNNELSEVNKMSKITPTSYYVDYNNGVVYFHPSKAGKIFIFNYYGLGYELLSASRVFLEHDVNGQTIRETLQEIIDKGRECIDALNTIGNAIELLKKIENYIIVATELDIKLKEDIRIGDQLHIDLTNDISTGSTLHKNLTNDITVGDKLHNNLTNDISTGTTLDTNLKASITEGNTTKSELDKSRLEAQDDIATIKATGNGTWTIPSSAWVGIAPNLTCIINHKMNSKNLLVGVVDTVTQKSVMNDYEIVDMNNIKMLSMEASNITVTINSQYYSGKDANTIAQEVQDARGAEANLKARLDKVDININNRVVKVDGKGLSTNDYTTSEQVEVAKIKNKADNIDSDRTTTAKDVTGAINELDAKSEIERGTNTNGMYVRFADGTQICTNTVSITVAIDQAKGAMFSSLYGSQLGDFAKSFAGTSDEIFIDGCVTSGGGAWAFNSQLYNTTTTSAGSVFLFRPVTADSQTYKFTYKAIGRWK